MKILRIVLLWWGSFIYFLVPFPAYIVQWVSKIWSYLYFLMLLVYLLDYQRSCQPLGVNGLLESRVGVDGPIFVEMSPNQWLFPQIMFSIFYCYQTFSFITLAFLTHERGHFQSWGTEDLKGVRRKKFNITKFLVSTLHCIL